MCRVKWQEELLFGPPLAGMAPVVCRDDGWNDQIWGGWVCDDAPGALFGVCESGVAENVSGDCDGRPVGSVMLHESGVDVPDGGESGQSGSWENDADHGVVQVVNVSFVKCVWDVVVVHMDWGAVGPWHVVETVENMGVVLGRVVVGRMGRKDVRVEWEEKVDWTVNE